jgi:hypothetical protein
MKRKAEEAELQPITRLDLDRLIVWAANDISVPARLLLCFYASHLGIEGVGEGRTAVYPGSERACAFLKVSKESLKRYKRELEEAGYILRLYDNRNQPLQGGAIDLRPLLARRGEMQGRIDRIDASLKKSRAERRAPEAASVLTPRGATGDLQNKKDKILGNRCGDEKGEGEGRTPCPAGTAEGRKVIERSLDHAPKLRAALGGAVESLRDPGEALMALQGALPGLFPEDSARSIQNTGLRGIQRLGPRLFAAAALAVHDPEVRSPAAYLGRLVMKAEGFDEEAALRRLAELHPKEAERPRHACPLAARFVAAFAERAGEGAAASYLAPDSTEIVLLPKGRLELRHRSPTALTRLKERYGVALRGAAEEIGASGLELRRLAPRPEKEPGRAAFPAEEPMSISGQDLREAL